jgi:hypothetical protein
MTRSRRSLCGHSDDDPLYVTPIDPGYEPQDRARVDAALAHLAQVLNALPGPVDGAVADLTARDIATLLARAPLDRRKHALSALGIPVAPRSVGQALCSDVRARLERAHLHDVIHCGAVLTQSVRRDLFDSAHNRRNADSDAPDLTVTWTEATLRFALWTGVRASPADARLLAWAATQPWFRPRTLSEAHAREVLAAARAVVEATPDFGADGTEQHVTGPAAIAPAAGHAPADTATAGGAPSAGEAATVLSGREGDVHLPRTTGADRLDDLRAERTNLEAVLTSARAAARRLLEAADAGCLPTKADINAVVALRENLQHLAAALPLEGATAPSVTAIDSALAALEEQASRSSARARLEALRTLDGGPVLAAPLAALRSLVDDTVARFADPGVAGTVAALTALADLIDLIATGGPAHADPQRLADLQERCGPALPPPQLALLPVAALTGQLSWGSAATQTTGTAGGHDTNQITTVDAAQSAPMLQARLPDQRAPGQGPADQPPLTDSARSDAEMADAAAHTAAIPDVAAPPGSSAPAAAPPSRPVPAPPATPGPAGSPPATLETQSAASDGSVTAVVSDLIMNRRFGMAAELAERAGIAEPRPAMLRLSALADAVRGETGPCASRLRLELPTLDADLLAADTPALRLAVPALIRVALVTGEYAAGALLTALAGRLERHLAAIAEQVGRRALQGVLTGNPLRTVLADVGELTAQVDQAAVAARERLRPGTLRFKRATDIAKEWLAAEGILGSLLTAAADDDRSRRAEVTAQVLRLSGHGIISKEIDRLDAKYKGTSGRPIQGAGRQDLVNLATDALHRVSAWLESVIALERATQVDSTWATSELTEMRAAVLEHADDALAALDAQIGQGDAISRAVAVASRESLDLTFALLRGSAALPPREPLADLVLTAELLKVPRATVEPASGLVKVPADTGVDALVAAVARSWQEAFDAQVAAEEYPTAEYLLAVVQSGAPPMVDAELGRNAAGALQTAEHRSQDELRTIREQLLAELRRARLRNEISEEQDGELTTMLGAADPGMPAGGWGDGPRQRGSLAAVREQLQEVARLLPAYREEAAWRLRDRLERLVQQPAKPVPVDARHIQRLIDAGELSTAEELIYYCEVGEPVPQVTVREDLTRFFPAVPDALPSGITDEVIEASRTGGVIAGCDMLNFGRLSEAARTSVADALNAWQLLGRTPIEGRNMISERSQLLPALRVAGFEFDVQTKVNRLNNVQKGTERRFVEVTNVSWNGNPIVPQFGSKLGGRLRMMLCWGQPAEDLLMSWVDQDPSGDAILVAYFGTMSAGTRRRLASRMPITSAPVIVLDDAALAYLAACGDRQLDAAISILAPFSTVQPYVRHKRSLVAPEMFYGRDKERKAVLDPNGTQVIFGGRGLGKSALLRDAKAAFEREPERVAIHIELTTADIGPGRQPAEAVWDLLLRDLDGTVITSSKSERRGKSKHEIVRAGVRAWLEGDSRRRLLILLDESDGFFEADSTQFPETNRLKDLGQMPGFEGRAKVVFAGLHSVQRFAKVSNNTFKHLAQRPTVIGPLRPQFAYDLIARPMQALGYTFTDQDLVNRILGYCSYQPFLLQMFGHRLVEHMHARRARQQSALAGEPPFRVTAEDVMEVEADPELTGDITSTFRDTLNLDPRYNVIANVLAYHAHEHGMDHRLTEVELRNECQSYWPEGFAVLDIEGFRAYLNEMTGLGVLAPNHDQRGWHLRSPNVLRMIGSQLDVLAELMHAASETVPSEFIALATRRALPDGTRAPLTAAQIDDLLGDHANQVRLVLGSRATRIEQVSATLRAVCQDLAGRYNLIDTRSRKQFEDALVEGRPGERRVVLSDLFALCTKNEGCTASLAAALQQRPMTAGVTRSVVLVTGPDQLGFWQQTFAKGEQPVLGSVALRRLDRRALHVWSLGTDHFTTSDRQTRLLEVTGGWPYLTERAVAMAVEHGSEDAALAELARELNTDDGAADLVDTIGLAQDRRLADAFDMILAYAGSEASVSDLLDAIRLADHPEPEAALSCLEALAIFDVDATGLHSVEPLLARCWHSYPLRSASASSPSPP